MSSKQYVEVGSQDYHQMIEKCVTQKGKSNYLYLCCECWAFLTTYQKNKHILEHSKALHTPIQFNSEEQISVLAEKFKKTKEIDGKTFIEVIKDKPLNVFKQGKHHLYKRNRSNEKENKEGKELKSKKVTIFKIIIYIVLRSRPIKILGWLRLRMIAMQIINQTFTHPIFISREET